MTAEEQKKEWARKGLCVQCGIIQISRKTSLFGMKREALVSCFFLEMLLRLLMFVLIGIYRC